MSISNCPYNTSLPSESRFSLRRPGLLHHLLIFAWLGLAIVNVLPARAETGPWIRNVVINRNNVFSPENGSLSGTAKLANKLHVVTREVTIKRELLFNAGDALDMELVAETERNLRGLSFLNHAEIAVEPASPDSVDVFVTVHDQWSLVPVAVLTSGGGLTRFGFGIEEANLLGRGKFLWGYGIYENDVGTTWSGGYDDPQLFGSTMQAGFSLANGPLIKSVNAYFEKPFKSSDTPWSWGGWGYLADEIERLFDAGQEVSRFETNIDEASVFATRSIGKRYRKWRFTIDYTYLYETHHAIPGQTTLPLSDDELVHATTLEVSRENHFFVEARRMNKFRRIEDLTLGNHSSLAVGRTGFPIPKGVKRWQIYADHSHSFQLSPSQLLFLTVGFTTKVEKDTIFSFGTRWYNFLKWQTIAFNLRGNFSNDLDVSRQFVLGGDSGLRGYPARQFTGDKLLNMNLETRIFPSLEVLTVALGGVVFVDVGNVWDRDESVDFKDLNAAAGAGLRLGFTRTPSAPVSRIDVGWPINRSGGPVLTFGVEQQF
jgi:hypothetical protein